MNSLPHVLECGFSDFDELTDAIQGWQLELYKLDIDPFQGRIFQLMGPDFILSHGYFSNRLKQVGAPPTGFRTFVVPADPGLQMIWRGQRISGSDLLIFPEGSELHALTEARFNIYTLSISAEALLKTAARQGVPELEAVLHRREVIHCRPSAMAETRGILSELEKVPALHPFASNQMLIALVQLLAGAGKANSSPLTKTRRQRIVMGSEKLIALHPEDPMTVQRLCEHTGVSRRTLEYAFDEQIGVTPKYFINAIRLNAVRKQLRSGTVQKVADAANAWGFWHMGQFAKDYRKFFGELPSDTFKNTR